MREKYHITGLHKHDSAKKYFDEAKNKEVLGKKDGNGFISVSPNPLVRSGAL